MIRRIFMPLRLRSLQDRENIMEPVRIREDVDPNSPEYRRQLIIVSCIVVFLTVTGGACLGYRIRTMEAMNAELAAKKAEEEAAQEEAESAAKDGSDKAAEGGEGR